MGSARARTAALGACLLALGAGGGLREDVPRDTLPETLPLEVPLGLPASMHAEAASDEVVALGRRLFFDPVLSIDRSIACASCHDPEHGFADPRPKSLGVHGQVIERNAPTLLNRALGTSFLWDGRAGSLEQQALMVIANAKEMALPIGVAVERLNEDAAYADAFEQAFGGPPTAPRLAGALAGFVRRLVRGDSRVDRFRRGEREALTKEERAGLWIFESTGACWRCHSGPNFTDEDFHNTGVTHELTDVGRFAITGEEADRGAFKTPTLRGVALTAPYGHDGSLATLEEVVELYRDGGHANGHVDPLVKPLELSDEDVANLVAFLRAL